MSKSIRDGPWQLRFIILEREINQLLYLTSNGVGKEVTIEPKNELVRQIVRLDIILACIIDKVPYSGILFQ